MITQDSKTVLIADDDLFFRVKIGDILREAGHKVLLAKDGKEAVSEIQNAPVLHLLLLDLQMPELDGFGVLKWIKDAGLAGRFPVLVITGVFEPGGVMEDLRHLGAKGLIAKDFAPEHIVFRVNNALFSEKVAKDRPKRVPVSIPVEFSIGGTRHSGQFLNLSEAGAFLHTDQEILTGANLHLKFSLPGADKTIEAKATVRWTTGEAGSKTQFSGAGIMYSSISPHDQESLREFMSRETKRLGL